MRTRNLVVIFFITAASIVSLVLFLLQDETSLESLPPIASPQEPAKTPVTAPLTDDGTKKTLTNAPPALAPDLKGISVDPNKPRPLPAIADSMPSSPPPMPMMVPAMPSEPPSMPNLVAPGDGSMPYDPSVYDPQTHAVAQKKDTQSKPQVTTPKKTTAPSEKNSSKRQSKNELLQKKP